MLDKWMDTAVVQHSTEDRNVKQHFDHLAVNQILGNDKCVRESFSIVGIYLVKTVELVFY